MDYTFESLVKNHTGINESARKFLDITRDDYGLCGFVQYRSADPRQKIRGWCCDKKEDVAAWVGISRPGLYKMIDRLEKKGLLETDAKGNLCITAYWIDVENQCKQSLQSQEKEKKENVNKVYSDCKQSLQKNGENVNLVTPNIELDISKSKLEILSGKPDGTEIQPLEAEKKKQKVHPAAALENKIEALREKLKTAAEPERAKIIKEGKALKAQLETENKIDAVILRLNEKAGFQYKLTTVEARKVIGKRLAENSLEEIFQVIDFKTKEWKDKDEMRQYLRPSTLFNGHFEDYYQCSLLKPTTKKTEPAQHTNELHGITFRR